MFKRQISILRFETWLEKILGIDFCIKQSFKITEINIQVEKQKMWGIRLYQEEHANAKVCDP